MNTKNVSNKEKGNGVLADVIGLLPTIDECLKFAWDETQKENKVSNIDTELLIKIIKFSQGNNR